MQEESVQWDEIKRPGFQDLVEDVYEHYSWYELLGHLLGRYFWLGLLVGLMIPLLSLWFHVSIEQRPLADVLTHQPLQFQFLTVPFLTGFLCGGMNLFQEIVLQSMRTEFSRDYLTGLYDHRFFRVSLRQQIELADRYDQELSLLFLDLDNFKDVNDEYGHPTGDQVLKEVAEIFESQCRSADIPCRYGGEEFALILPQTSPEEAAILAERIRSTVGKRTFTRGTHLTISGGIAHYPTDASNNEELIKVADQRLYNAKENGRNQMVGSAS